MIKLASFRTMKGNITDDGVFHHIIKHSDDLFVVVTVDDKDLSNVANSVITCNKNDFEQWAKPLIENGAIDVDNYDWFISDRNV